MDNFSNGKNECKICRAAIAKSRYRPTIKIAELPTESLCIADVTSKQPSSEISSENTSNKELLGEAIKGHWCYNEYKNHFIVWNKAPAETSTLVLLTAKVRV